MRLSDAQVSALECREWDEPVLSAWRGKTLVVTEDTRESLWEALNEASNAEDAQAEIQGCQFARRAARSLSIVAGKVLTGAT